MYLQKTEMEERKESILKGDKLGEKHFQLKRVRITLLLLEDLFMLRSLLLKGNTRGVKMCYFFY